MLIYNFALEKMKFTTKLNVEKQNTKVLGEIPNVKNNMTHNYIVAKNGYIAWDRKRNTYNKQIFTKEEKNHMTIKINEKCLVLMFK